MRSVTATTCSISDMSSVSTECAFSTIRSGDIGEGTRNGSNDTRQWRHKFRPRDTATILESAAAGGKGTKRPLPMSTNRVVVLRRTPKERAARKRRAIVCSARRMPPSAALPAGYPPMTNQGRRRGWSSKDGEIPGDVFPNSTHVPLDPAPFLFASFDGTAVVAARWTRRPAVGMSKAVSFASPTSMRKGTVSAGSDSGRPSSRTGNSESVPAVMPTIGIQGFDPVLFEEVLTAQLAGYSHCGFLDSSVCLFEVCAVVLSIKLRFTKL